MPSVLAPRWLRHQNFYPHWMGETLEIAVSITGTPSSPIYSPDEKIDVFINAIYLKQDNNIHELPRLLDRKQFRKKLNPPEITVYKVNFKDDTT